VLSSSLSSCASSSDSALVVQMVSCVRFILLAYSNAWSRVPWPYRGFLSPTEKRYQCSIAVPLIPELHSAGRGSAPDKKHGQKETARTQQGLRCDNAGVRAAKRGCGNVAVLIEGEPTAGRNCEKYGSEPVAEPRSPSAAWYGLPYKPFPTVTAGAGGLAGYLGSA
jgi:hypothetical protein